MKNNWSKKVRAALALIAPMVLVACGNNTTSDKNNDTKENEPITMKIGQQTQPNSKLPEGDSYADNAYRRLIKDKLNITIESAFEANGDDYDRQVALAIASGDLPDIMTVDRDELEELANNGLIEDLTDVFDKYASDNIKAVYKSFDDFQLKAATIDGKLMAVPGVGNDFGPNLVWIRQDWLDKLGIKLDPDGNHAITLDELESTAKAFIDKDASGKGNTKGLAFAPWLSADNHGGTAYTANPIMNAFGAYPKVYLPSESGKIEYGSNTKEMKEALGYLNKLYKEGILDNQVGTRTYDDINAMNINGEIGIVTGPWHFPDWTLVQTRTANRDALYTPYAIEGKDGKVSGVQKPGAGGFVVVRKGFEHPEALIKMLNLIFDEVPNDNNMEQDFPEIYQYAQKAVDGSVRPMNIEMFKNLSEIDDAVTASNAAEGKSSIDDIHNFTVKNNAKHIKAYLDNPKASDPTEFAVYSSRLLAVRDVMGGVRNEGIYKEIKPVSIVQKVKATERNGAQIGKLEEENFIKFVTGEQSLDDFDKYVSTWNEQGGTAIINEMQEIVNKQ